MMQGLAGLIGPLVQATQANQAIMTEVLKKMNERGVGKLRE